MTGRELRGEGAVLVMCLSITGLLSAGVGNVLLAATESLLWPLILGVLWVVVAAAVTVAADPVAAPSRSRTRPVVRAAVDAAGLARPR